jgi:hypothetical protein
MDKSLAVSAEFHDLPGGMVMIVMPELTAEEGWVCFLALEPDIQRECAGAVLNLLELAHGAVDEQGR